MTPVLKYVYPGWQISTCQSHFLMGLFANVPKGSEIECQILK
jgi:hypothetical protein